MKLVVNSTTGETELVPYAQHELDDLAAVPSPDPKDAIRADIAQLLAQAKLVPGQEWLLDVAMASMVSAGATQGLSEPELYAANPGYRTAKDMAAQVAAKLALL